MKKFENFQSNLRMLEQAGQQDLSNRFVLGRYGEEAEGKP